MKTIYVIPGLGESFKEARYKKLAKALRDSGHRVIEVNPNWHDPLTTLVFPVTKASVVVGFSFGAVLAYLIAKKYPCKKVVLCSLSPLHQFTFAELYDEYVKHMDEERARLLALDVLSIRRIAPQTLKMPHITLVGAKEVGMPSADLMVPNSGHYMTKEYIRAITTLV